ncbi:DUF1800 domain-containing protein [Ramlibacter albus]|uniref:DUF1800 domain-containing protein n=1 Tax=Ramlibacter albus TaxID=2079448 RepID=A0A923M7L7_9BURK|nr:DUF1800 domain-containing protein [Ramlibacter albus]MBC5764204.1 DUF1800 domain-containing protein [Ramlibacter albus]
MSASAIALNRFGLGARPDEPPPADPQRWLLSQFDRYEALPAPWQARARTPALVEVWLAQQRAVRRAPPGERAGIREAYVRQGRDEYVSAVGARATSALQASAPFVERLVHFWSNHFAVSVDKLAVIGMAGSFEADAIRPHVLGRFEDMLLAVVQHPAMLLFLDQAQSVGPTSFFAMRGGGGGAEGQQNRRGLNENLAREILELHTMGVRSGYTQQDVTEFARALTGWTLPGDGFPGAAGTPTFRFVPALHEPGARTVLGRTYAEGGEQQARAILHDLVTSQATARHVASKLARHFVADEPPPALVQRLADTFARTGGDLPSVYRELVTAREAWQATAAKFKSPWDWGVSSLRALGRQELTPMQATTLMNQLGQPVWRPGSPAGYADIAATWAAPDALLRRVEVAQRVASQAGDAVDARALAPRVLPGTLSEATAGAIARAESASTATALLLVSPEFLRR